MKGVPFDPGTAFRRLSAAERRLRVEEFLGRSPDLLGEADPLSASLDLADTLSENTFGLTAFPAGLCRGIRVNGRERTAVMATEEPSVIAAANYGCRIVASGGGFDVSASPPQMGVQVFFDPSRPPQAWEEWFASRRPSLEEIFREASVSMERRGGGFRELLFAALDDGLHAKITAYIDVRDAMGANMLNSCGERAAAFIEQESGLRPVMAILSNSAERRKTTAAFKIPVGRLPSVSGISSRERALRIVAASRIAAADPDRAVTHNKGIMNGITAVALATANDTRGLEAAVHAWAARSGRYTALSRFDLVEEGDEACLAGRFEAPLPLAVVGGAVGFHPAAVAALELMGNPDAAELAELAAAVGLGQNLAALLALTGEGIQKGHMRLHARRIAFAAGFRGSEIDRAADKLHAAGTYSVDDARRLRDAEES